MIYLIGGPPRCGKSRIAKAMAKHLGISYLSCDTLESVVQTECDERDYDTYFPKKIMREKTNNSNDQMYSRYTTPEIVAAYISHGQSTYQAIQTFIQCSIRDQDDYVIEGHHLHPFFINDLMKQFPDLIKSVVLLKKDLSAITRHIQKNNHPNDWAQVKTQHPRTYAKIAAMIQCYSSFYNKKAKENHIPTLFLDEHDVPPETRLQQVLDLMEI